MATFNSMPVLPTGGHSSSMPMNNGSVQQPPQQQQPLGMDNFDHEMAFDDSMLDGSALSNLPFTPGYDFDTFSTTFEDPFSYSSRTFNPTPTQDVFQEEASPQELDNKLLGFSDAIINTAIVDDAGQFADVVMGAELYGMFFVAEDVFGGEPTGRPYELTCYRRNLWQCSGQVTLPRAIRNIVDDQGQHVRVSELLVSITAMESIDGKPTEIISIPWKSSNGPPGEDSKVIGAPPTIPLDLSAGQELDPNRVSLPVAWKRLQFKHATANNGRRKGLQQHYVVQINLLGRAEAGNLIKIAEIQSGPVIVRGRSPRNFDSKKDVSLTSEKRNERRGTSGSDNASLKVEKETLQASVPSHNSAGSCQSNDRATPQPISNKGQGPPPAKKVALSPKMPKPPIPSWSKESISSSKSAMTVPRGSISRQSTSVPINLSLSEDERSPNRSSNDGQSPRTTKTPTMLGQHTASSPSEEADPLYEYFPLSVDDWMPPVDAVYRPHVVHHTIVPPEIKAQQVRNKAKRYFAPD